MSENAKPFILSWLFAGCMLVYLMVMIGGITRLTRSGLSMVEWSPTGSLPPMNEKEWIEQFDKYKQFPEYQLINNSFTLTEFKKIYFWEYTHRLIGRTIGILFILPFLWFSIKNKFPEYFLKKMIILLGIGILQGLLGWFMVKSGLARNPHVSHYRLAAHLITAFAAFGFTFWFALDLLYPRQEEQKNKFLKNLSVLLLSIIILQIIYGAFVAGLKAGYAYPTFPKMGSHWIPDEIKTLEPVWKKILEGQAGVQFIHRCLAYVIVVLCIILFTQKQQLNAMQKKILNGICLTVLLQFIAGVIIVLFGVPIFIAALHQTIAFILFALMLFFIHRI